MRDASVQYSTSWSLCVEQFWFHVRSDKWFRLSMGANLHMEKSECFEWNNVVHEEQSVDSAASICHILSGFIVSHWLRKDSWVRLHVLVSDGQ